MATGNASVTVAKGVIRTSWTLTGTETGDAETSPQYPEKSVQVKGTFAGGTVLIEGSNDGGTTYFTLTDPQGNPLAFTAAGGERITENVTKVRPRASVAVTSVTIELVSQSRS
jgi:hypothetical protein